MKNVPASELPAQPDTVCGAIDPLNIMRILHPVSGVLFSQIGLYGRLVGVEWAEEKNRLLGMLIAAASGFVFILCLVLFIGVLVLALSWDGIYRIPAILAMLAVYGLGIGVARQQFQKLSALSSQSFAAAREEVAADMALIKSKMYEFREKSNGQS